jgi:CRP-like cAMP-binding protein
VATAGQPAAADFARIMRRQSVAEGDAVLRGAADEEGLTVVAQGVVMEQRILSDGRRQIVAFRFPGDAVGITDGFDPFLQSVAMTPVVICHVGGKALAVFARAHPAAAERLARLGGAEAARLADHLLVLGRLTAAERVAAFLLDCLTRAGTTTAEGVTCALPMNRDDIADYLGLNVETVSRQLSRMKKVKLIRLPKPGRVVVPDLASLAALVPFTPVGPNAGPGTGSAALSETPAAA